MRRIITEDQVAPDSIQIGSEIRLKVGHNPKRHCSAFIPQFVDRDNLLDESASYYYNGSIRIFIPNEPVQIATGEIWKVKVIASRIGNKITADGRAHVYVYIEVLSREECVEYDPDYAAMQFFMRTKSGDRIIAEKSVPIERIPVKFYKQNNTAVQAILFEAAGQFFDVTYGTRYLKGEFVSHLAKSIGKSANTASLAKAFNKLPVLPELVNVEAINF